MFKTIFLSLFLTIPLCSTIVAVEDKYLEVQINDASGGSKKDVFISCDEGCAQTVSDSRGKARLKLPRQLDETDWVTIKIQGWLMISPWNGKLNIPSFTNKPKDIHLVVVAHKGDREILKSGDAVAALTAKILSRVKEKYEAKLKDEITRERREVSNEERDVVLQEVADSIGFSPEELDEAIRELGRRTQDPFQQGLVALYEQNYPKAEELLTRSYELRKETKAKADAAKVKADSDLADAAFFLGESLYAQGKYNEAVIKLQEVDALRKDDMEVLDLLGSSLNLAGRNTEAEPLYKRALAITEKEEGSEHPYTGYRVSDLADNYRAQRKYAEAEPLYKRALAITEKVYGPEHPVIADSLRKLARLYRAQEKYTEAEPLFKRALTISEKWRGPEHPDTANSLSSLARLYLDQGKYTQAEPLYKRALAISEKAHGPEGSSTKAGLTNLGEVYRAQGKYTEAEPLFKRALAITERERGAEHPNTGQESSRLARLYLDQRKYTEAESLFKRALAIYEKTLGPEHPNVATVLVNYASLLRATGKDSEAEKLEARVSAIRKK